MQKKKMQEELQGIKEKFSATPNWGVFFSNVERILRYYNCYEWEEGVSKEAITAQRDALLETLQRVDVYELKILYYIQNLQGWRAEKFFRLLKKQYKQQCDFLNALYQTDEFFDFVGMGFGKKGRKTKK